MKLNLKHYVGLIFLALIMSLAVISCTVEDPVVDDQGASVELVKSIDDVYSKSMDIDVDMTKGNSSGGCEGNYSNGGYWNVWWNPDSGSWWLTTAGGSSSITNAVHNSYCHNHKL